jgi:hypothetical protein
MNCENCEDEHKGTYGSGRFCSSKCARGFSTKEKRSLINAKVSILLKGKESPKKGIILVEREIVKCANPECKKEIQIRVTENKNPFCSRVCSSSFTSKRRCESIEEKERMRDIGRNGGFGKKGITEGGTSYQSLLEKNCFEYLENNGIDFIPHPKIPNSSKISDVYISNLDLWIEIDGINREYRKKWLGKNYDYWIEKLKIYEKYNMNLKIIYSLEELKQLIIVSSSLTETTKHC